MEVDLNCAGGGGSIYSKVLLFILTFSLNRLQKTSTTTTSSSTSITTTTSRLQKNTSSFA